MQKAIEQAIKGGYITGFRYDKLAKMDGITAVFEVLLLDPDFWKCLGIAEGWDKNQSSEALYVGEFSDRNHPRWKRNQHFLIDHIANGGSIEDFFKKILK